MHFIFSIDNHTMQVISTDFVPINPYVTDSLSIAIGMYLLQQLSFSLSLTCYQASATPSSSKPTNQSTTTGCAPPPRRTARGTTQQWMSGRASCGTRGHPTTCRRPPSSRTSRSNARTSRWRAWYPSYGGRSGRCRPTTSATARTVLDCRRRGERSDGRSGRIRCCKFSSLCPWQECLRVPQTNVVSTYVQPQLLRPDAPVPRQQDIQPGL